MNGNVKVLKQTEYEMWNQFAAKSPQGTLFHTYHWLEASGKEFRIYGYFKGEELSAGL